VELTFLPPSPSANKAGKHKEVTAGASVAEAVSGQADESQSDFRTSTRPALRLLLCLLLIILLGLALVSVVVAERPVWVEDKFAASCAKCTVDFRYARLALSRESL
jgi:hypothetical protein